MSPRDSIPWGCPRRAEFSLRFFKSDRLLGDTMSKKQTAHHDDMPAKIDFSKGVRGKFYHTGAKLNLPVYLDEQVQTRLVALASAKGVDLSVLGKCILRKD